MDFFISVFAIASLAHPLIIFQNEKGTRVSHGNQGKVIQHNTDSFIKAEAGHHGSADSESRLACESPVDLLGNIKSEKRHGLGGASLRDLGNKIDAPVTVHVLPARNAERFAVHPLSGGNRKVHQFS